MSGPILLDDRQAAFVAAARRATLSTIGPDGRPRSVPVCFVLGTAGNVAGPAIFSPLDEKPKASANPRALARVRDLGARPAATLLVDRWSEDWDRLGWVRLDVVGTLVEPGAPDHATAIADLRVKYPQYAGHDLATRPILRFTIERVVPWGDLDLDPPGPADRA
jgi:PPOX class probable F420-dependent enzyme